MTTRDDLALANRLADAARTAIRPFFRARYDMEFKSDQSPVTEADRATGTAGDPFGLFGEDARNPGPDGSQTDDGNLNGVFRHVHSSTPG